MFHTQATFVYFIIIGQVLDDKVKFSSMMAIRIITLFLFTLCVGILPAHAIQKQRPTALNVPYAEPLNLILKDKILPLPIERPRPQDTDLTPIYAHTKIEHLDVKDKTIDACQTVLPYTNRSLPHQIGRTIRYITNNTHHTIEAITIQPSFSGLYGPSFLLTRRTIERAMNKPHGNAPEIFHDAKLSAHQTALCPSIFRLDFDLSIKTQIDLSNAQSGTLVRSDAIGTARTFIGKTILTSLGIRVPIYNNLHKQIGFEKYSHDTDIAGSDYYTSEKAYGFDHLTLNGFFTLKPYLYSATQIGYIEDRFFGLGTELLYRPRNEFWAVGMDAWAVAHRDPFNPSGFAINDNKRRYSVMLNGYYDFAKKPLTISASAGRFIGGDYGGEIKAQYKPYTGWSFDAYARYSDTQAHGVTNDQGHVLAGLQFTIPLSTIRTMPDNGRATTIIEPFGWNTAQRIDNAQPLYTLTDPWSTANIYRHWNDITR